MRVTRCEVTGWNKALNAARATVGKEWIEKEPSDKFKHDMCRSEHSPLRMVEYTIMLEDVPMWVTVHLVRHHIGIEKFVRTQRTDRTGSDIPRDEHLQGELNSMMITLNAQSLINISKVRCCLHASPETRELWTKILAAVKKVDPIVVKYCVPSCIYRGVCGEMASFNAKNKGKAVRCGYLKSKKGQQERVDYVKLFENEV